MDWDVTHAQIGDREAMARLVEANYDAVFRFCARRIGPELAADAAQETFLTAQKAIKKFRNDSSLRTWLFGIAHNHCRHQSRKNRTESWDWTTMEDGGQSPENGLIDRQALRTALQGLSAEHREVVLLHEVEGLTYEEAAKVLNIPVGTVKSRLHHAFLGLRRALAGAEEVMA
jgi:RNA polymerase sigma-70 factor (ECF subfamily)